MTTGPNWDKVTWWFGLLYNSTDIWVGREWLHDTVRWGEPFVVPLTWNFNEEVMI